MFEFFRARSTDPITSFKAADSIKDVANQHMDIIVKCLKEFGPLGKDGIAKKTGLEPTQVSRRLKEMQTLDLIELTGKQVTSNSGRKEREWCFKQIKTKLVPNVAWPDPNEKRPITKRLKKFAVVNLDFFEKTHNELLQLSQKNRSNSNKV
jgi:DNA-binding Lrp family transcriptional regulator